MDRPTTKQIELYRPGIRRELRETIAVIIGSFEHLDLRDDRDRERLADRIADELLDDFDIARKRERPVVRGKRSFAIMSGVLDDHVDGLIARTQIRSEFARRFLLDEEDIEQRRIELRECHQSVSVGAANSDRPSINTTDATSSEAADAE
jgi:hypothetical protein